MIGLPNVPAEVVEVAFEITPIAAVQNAVGIANRTDAPVLDLCRAHGIAHVPFHPLGSAFADGPQALAADPAIAAVAQLGTGPRPRRSRSPGCWRTACC